MLTGRAIYIWNLMQSKGSSSIDDMVAKAQAHKISSVWLKIADGDTPYANVSGSVAPLLRELVTKCRVAGVSALGYHVPHCADKDAAAIEVKVLSSLVAQFELAGVVVDNEDGSGYFEGGPAEAEAYAAALRSAMSAVGRLVVMSSNDIVSAHAGSQAKVIGRVVDVNAPQVYYGASASVRSRLDWARKENASITAPFFPVGAAFVSKPSAADGGCASDRDCAARAEQFIRLVADLHRQDPKKYPGYCFWNWQEAPEEFWEVLARLDVFPAAPPIAALEPAPSVALETPATLDFRDLLAKLRNPDVPLQSLRPYFTGDPTSSRPFAPAVRINPARVDVSKTPQVEEAFALDALNDATRLRRQAAFGVRRLIDAGALVLVGEGDSWFQFPVMLRDIIDNLDNSYNIWSLAAAGDTLQNMVVDRPEYLQAVREKIGETRVLVFSGAGNDVLGADETGKSILAQIVRRFAAGKPAEWYIDTDAFRQKIAFVENCYRMVFSSVQAEFPQLPVICHGYDYAIPGGGPNDYRNPIWAEQDQWLGRPLSELGIVDHELQRAIVRLMIDRLNEKLKTLCGANNVGGAFKNAWHVDLRGTVDRLTLWADELHPTDDGFALVAAKFADLINKTILSAPARAPIASITLEALQGPSTPDGYRPPEASRNLLQRIPFDEMARVGENYAERFARWDATPKGKNDPSNCQGIYQHKSGAIFWESKMAVDADGTSTPSVLKSSSGSAENTSYMFRGDAAPVNAEIVPYFVLPDFDSPRRVKPGKPWEGSGDDFCKDFGIRKGTLGVVVYRDKIAGAIFADRGPPMKIGEASIRVHELIAEPGPWKGDPVDRILRDVSVREGVLYFVFPDARLDIDAFGPERQKEMAESIQHAAMQQFAKLERTAPTAAPITAAPKEDTVSALAPASFVCEGSGDPLADMLQSAAITAEAPLQKPPVDRVETTTHQSSRNGRDIDTVVIHYTTSRDIEGTIDHFKNGVPGKRVSAHYIIGRDGALVQMVPDDLMAWHAGDSDVNLRSIGIEHVAALGDAIAPDQEKTSLALIRWLMATYGVPFDRVIPHCCVHSTSCCGDLFKAYGGGAGLSCAKQTAALHSWLSAHGIVSSPGASITSAAQGDGGTIALAAPSLRLRPMRLSDPDVTMDPRLRRFIDKSARGERIAPTASTDEDQVAVMAVVTDVAAWQELEAVHNAVEIGPAFEPAGAVPKEWVVTGRIAAAQLESVRSLSKLVKSFKASQPVHNALWTAVPDVGARPVIPNTTSRGAGVVVGVVDAGCDFAHKNFIDPNGRTRIEAIWHQGGAADPKRAVTYGALYERERIQAALSTADPYATLGYGPQAADQGGTGAHGTHVMDIAAGSGGGSGVVGMASDATILFVDLSSDDIPWSGPQRIGRNFGDSVRLAEAIAWIFKRAGDRPCVINVSLGTNGGPHDGTNPFERAIDGLLHEKPNRAVVIAASNSRSQGIHARASVSLGANRDLRLAKRSDVETQVEVWYGPSTLFDIELLSPDGASLGRVQPGKEGRVDDGNGNAVVFISSRTHDPANGDNTIGLYLSATAPVGTWTLRLHNTSSQAGEFHAWIERNDFGQSSFITADQDPDFTLGSISCGHAAITVAAYDAHKNGRPISSFSSGGPTRDNRQKPEIAAPGVDLRAAQSGTFTGVVSKSGTSMAAPMVTGALAIMLGDAALRGQSLEITAIRQRLTNDARRLGNTAAWDNRYGFGGLDVTKMIGESTEAGTS